MNEINLEEVRAAMFTDPGVKAVDGLRLVPGLAPGRAIAATITVAAPSVDLDVVHAVIARVLSITPASSGQCFPSTTLGQCRRHPRRRP